MNSGSGQAEHLAIAVDPRPVVGWAVGIVMETMSCDLDEACRRLAQSSQNPGRDLYDIAAQFLVTRELPTG